MRQFLALVVSFLFISNANAQTESKVFQGAKTYYFNLDNNAEKPCLINDEEMINAAKFPLSYSSLKEINNAKADLIIFIQVSAYKKIKGEDCLFNYVIRINTAYKYYELPYNNKKYLKGITIYGFSGHGITPISKFEKFIKENIEDAFKKIVTLYNEDNK